MIEVENPWLRGEIIQIDPNHDPVFGACLLVVTEPKPWGAQGYVLVPDSSGAKRAFYRLNFEHGVRVGNIEWLYLDQDEYDEEYTPTDQ